MERKLRLHLSVEDDYSDCRGPDLCRVQRIDCLAGIGTHVDAPVHCFRGAKAVGALEPKDLITDCVVVKVDEEADENYVVTPDAIERFEKNHGIIQPNAFVIFYTGWERFLGRSGEVPERFTISGCP